MTSAINPNAEKALALVVKYSRLQTRIGQCKRTAVALYDACERQLPNGSSGCLNDLSELFNNNKSADDDVRLSFPELVDEAKLCRHCNVGLELRMHAKHKLGRRRASTLAAICRTGQRAVSL